MAAAPPPVADAVPLIPRGRRLRHRVAYAMIALLLIFIVVLLPFAIVSLVREFRHIPSAERSGPVIASGAVDRGNVAMDLIGMNEWEGTVTVRVTAQQLCNGPCGWRDRYRFVSMWGDDFRPSDRPTVEEVTVPDNPRVVTRTFTLPIAGDPLRYPFDHYALALGVAMDRLYPDGRVETLTLAQAGDYLTIWGTARIPRVDVHNRPQATAQGANQSQPYLFIAIEQFSRPLYLQVLTVFLVLLAAAAAAYAVLLRPLDQLIINAGALILGVWGIRSILLGASLPGLTAVDLSLWSVILFLLLTITVRTLWLLEEDSGWRPLRKLFHFRRHTDSLP